MIPFLISATVLIAAVIILRQIFKNRISRRLQYSLWLIVVIRLVLPIQLGTSPISIDRSTPVQRVENTVTQTVREPVSGPSYTIIYTQVAEEFTAAGQNIQTPEVQAQVRAEATQRIKVPTFGEIANTVWFVGCMLMGLWFLFVNLRFHYTLQKYSAELSVADCPIPVKVCGKLQSPCLSGILRPTVYLTENCTDDPQRLQHILAHELTHLHHGDLLWSAVRSILLCIYWFHPLVWAAAILSKRDCELACDEGALKRLGEDQRIPYGKTLLDTVARTPSPHHLLETATSMNETKKQLKERVNFIVKKPKFYLILTLCVLLITAVAVGCTFTGAPQPTITPTETTDPTVSPTEPEETQPSDPRLFTDAQLAELQTLFTGYYETRTNWYNAALLATFDSPQDIDAFDLFSVGTGNPADRRLTEEELDYLRSITYIGQGALPCRMSREYVESVLDQYFGLTTADLKTTDPRFTYWEETDCYYVVSEGHAALDFKLLGARRQEDGTILFEYYRPYIISPKYIYETVLRPVSGGYHVLSNRVIEKSNLNPKSKLENETPPATEDLIKKLETLFAKPQAVDTIYYNWYNDCLRAHLSCPEDLDLAKIFCGRTGIPDTRQLTEAENAYLQEFYSMYIALYNNIPIQRIPRETVEQVLYLYYGLSTEDVYMESSDMVYWEETDCYYVIVDSEGVGQTKVLRVDVLSDNSIRMLYTDPTDTYRDTVYEAVLRPALGGYQILSNLPVVDREIMESCPLSPSPRPNPMNILNMATTRRDGAFNFALKSVYEDPADVNIYSLFHSMPKDDTPSDAEIEFAISKGLNPEICPIYRYPVSTIDSVLCRVFGIGFDECNGVGLEHFVYDSKNDCYYESHGDFESGSYTPTYMIQQADGSVQIYYNGSMNYESLPMVVTLIPTETSWHIVSNLPAPDPTDTSWQPVEKASKSYDEYFSLTRHLGYQQISNDLTWTGANGAEYTLQSMAESGLCVLNNTQEILWTVPGTENPSGIQWLVCDGQWAYGVLNNNLLRIELQTGKLETLFTGEKMLCGSTGYNAANLMVCDRSFVLFAAVNNGKGCIYRLYLPTMTLDTLCDEIPADTLPCWLEIWMPENNRHYPFMFLNPQLQPILYDTLSDPNSPYKKVIEAWPDSVEEPMIVDMSQAWAIPDLMTTHKFHSSLEWLIISLQSANDLPGSVLWVYDQQENTIIQKNGMLHTGNHGFQGVIGDNMP